MLTIVPNGCPQRDVLNEASTSLFQKIKCQTLKVIMMVRMKMTMMITVAAYAMASVYQLLTDILLVICGSQLYFQQECQFGEH